MSAGWFLSKTTVVRQRYILIDLWEHLLLIYVPFTNLFNQFRSYNGSLIVPN